MIVLLNGNDLKVTILLWESRDQRAKFIHDSSSMGGSNAAEAGPLLMMIICTTLESQQTSRNLNPAWTPALVQGILSRSNFRNSCGLGRAHHDHL